MRAVSAIAVLLLAAVALLRLLLAPADPMIHEISGVTMGTTFSVRIDADDSLPVDLAYIRDTIQGTLDRIEHLMSTYDSASELSRLNRHESVDPYGLSGATLEVFRIAEEVSGLSGGALDVTVAPLVDAWGFGPDGRRPERPSEAALKELSATVGYELLTIDPSGRVVIKGHPKVVADLSAVAKGYGVDEVVRTLAGLGLTSFMVEVGGELRARGTKSDGTHWTVGIERPDAEVRASLQSVDLVNMAVATSGDYRNYYEVDGIRYSHLIDPRTGSPVKHSVASVTVLHPHAAYADAWATALVVLGLDEGRALADQEEIAALFLIRSGDEFEAQMTTAWNVP